MKIIKADNYDEMSRLAANIIAAQVILKPESVLGLATGSTPLGTYARLAQKNKSGDVDFSRVTTVNLDEYVNLPIENEQSYRNFMNTNLFSKINIDPEKTHVPCGISSDLSGECKKYDELIESLGGIDLQLLGIGFDGHIGFNEPDNIFIKETHVVRLDESTIDANSRFFESRSNVPTQAVTMGMGAIMGAKKILMIANGKAKVEILTKAFEGSITPLVPASIIRIFLDRKSVV